MASFTDTVRFCFPAARTDSPPLELPLDARRNSANKDQRRPDAVNWGVQDDNDLNRSTIPCTVSSIIKSYAPDWLLAAVLWVVLAVLNRTGGHQREFSLTDISIQHSHAIHERVPPV